MTVTIPNKLFDLVEKDMEEKGEINLSRKISTMIEQWAAIYIDGEEPTKQESQPSNIFDLEKELARFKGFSTSSLIPKD